jgi:hypothetical protein
MVIYLSLSRRSRAGAAVRAPGGRYGRSGPGKSELAQQFSEDDDQRRYGVVLVEAANSFSLSARHGATARTHHLIIWRVFARFTLTAYLVETLCFISSYGILVINNE